MIHDALQFTGNVLNTFLKQQFDLDENAVVLNRVVDANGSLPQVNQNKVVLTAVNIQAEHSISNLGFIKKGANVVSPSFRACYLLANSNFDDYAEALKFLDVVFTFFNDNPVLTAEVHPNMPAGLTKIVLEIVNTNFEDLDNIWSMLGAKYQPSLIYKVRLL